MSFRFLATPILAVPLLAACVHYEYPTYSRLGYGYGEGYAGSGYDGGYYGEPLHAEELSYAGSGDMYRPGSYAGYDRYPMYSPWGLYYHSGFCPGFYLPHPYPGHHPDHPLVSAGPGDVSNPGSGMTAVPVPPPTPRSPLRWGDLDSGREVDSAVANRPVARAVPTRSSQRLPAARASSGGGSRSTPSYGSPRSGRSAAPVPRGSRSGGRRIR